MPPRAWTSEERGEDFVVFFEKSFGKAPRALNSHYSARTMPAFDMLCSVNQIVLVLGRNGDVARRVAAETGAAIELLSPPSTSFFTSFEPEQFCEVTSRPDKALQGLGDTTRAVRVTRDDIFSHAPHQCPAQCALFKLYARLKTVSSRGGFDDQKSVSHFPPFRLLATKGMCDVSFIRQRTGANVRVVQVAQDMSQNGISHKSTAPACAMEIVEVDSPNAAARQAAMHLACDASWSSSRTSSRVATNSVTHNTHYTHTQTERVKPHHKRYHAIPPQAPSYAQTVTSVRLPIPSGLVRVVVCPGGSSIQKVRAESGAKVKLHDPVPGASVRFLELGGSCQTVAKAKALVVRCLEQCA